MPNFCSLSVSSCLERTVCPTIDWVPCGNDTLASLALFHLASKVRPAQVTFKKLLAPTDSCSGSLQRQSHSGPSILFSHDLPQMWSWIKLCPSMLIFFFFCTSQIVLSIWISPILPSFTLKRVFVHFTLLRPLLPAPSEVLSICLSGDLSLYGIPVCICLPSIKWVFYGSPITGINHPSSVFSVVR